jgi:PAS domain S-box-containing protein
MTRPDVPHDVLPEAAAAAELRQHLEELARDRDQAYRVLQEREAELARIQRIGRVGGLEVDLRKGFRNRRSPEYLILHGLPPEAANETHDDWVRRLHPEDRARAERQFIDALKGRQEDYTAEYRIIRPNDGETRWIRVVAFVNRAYLDFLGLPFDEAIVYDWRHALHPDDLPRVLQEQIAGETSLKPFVLEARYRRADGEWRWLRSESQPRWDATGGHVGFIGVAHDVTAAKQAEIELRRVNETLEQRIRERTAQLEANEARMRAMVESSNQYQGILDLDGHVLHANKTALAGIRAEPDAVVGKPFWNTPWFTATEGMSEIVRNVFGGVLKGETVRTEMRLQLPIGERHFDFTMRPLFDQHGTVTGAMPEAVDVTERIQGEELLRQSQKMEAIGQLTGGVAHDFNNLLTIIRSATDFLRRRDLPEERRRRYVDAISETVERASKLTAQLLAFARRQPLTPQVFNVGEQVESVVQLIRPLVGSRIQIDVAISDPDVFTLADIAQFQTALINLAVNARDAMDGEGQLTIGVRKAGAIPAQRGQPPRAGTFIAISVADTGSGIAPEHLSAIFEPFFTTKEVGKGTGLGLSQAFGFAKQSEGDIAVASQLGNGATFTIYLPQAAPPAAEADIAASRSEPATIGRGYRVLVVEDNDEVGRFSTELLEDLGYVVRRVANGNDALAILAENEFAVDLVFSDVIMPGINGLELAGIIRERYPGLPVVLTSGYSHVLAENAHHGFELIKKPYSVELLSRILRKAMAERSATVR